MPSCQSCQSFPRALNLTPYIVQNRPKSVAQSRPKLPKLAQTCPNLPKLVQTCPNLPKLVQTCPKLLKNAPMCPKLHTIETCTCPNLSAFRFAVAGSNRLGLVYILCCLLRIALLKNKYVGHNFAPFRRFINIGLTSER